MTASMDKCAMNYRALVKIVKHRQVMILYVHVHNVCQEKFLMVYSIL